MMKSGVRTAGLAAMIVGAIVSVAMLVHVGNRIESNKAQPVVMVLIAIWVLSPYVLLVAGSGLSRNWSELSRATLYWMMNVVAAISLVVYVPFAIGPIGPKPAAPFVGIPPLQWILIVVSLLIAARVGRRRSVSS